MNREQWLKRRRLGIGASEAAAVLGLSPYASPLSLFYEKTTGNTVEEDSEVQEWGLLLEPAIAAKYEKVTGRVLEAPEPFEVIQHPRYEFMIATPDRYFRVDPANVLADGTVELKTSAYFNKDEELPLHWQIQVQSQLAITGLGMGSFAILVAGRKFFYADVPRNDPFIALLIEKMEEFWDGVLKGVPPNPDGHSATTEALKRMYPKDNGGVLKLPAEAVTWAAELASVKENIKALEARESEIQNHIRAALGDNTWGVLPDDSGWSMKATKRAGYTVEETEFRQLRRVKTIPKGLLIA